MSGFGRGESVIWLLSMAVMVAIGVAVVRLVWLHTSPTGVSARIGARECG
jgi:hypothetical protein